MLIPTKSNIKTVTDLREQTVKILNSLSKKEGPTVIFHRANPKAILLSIEAYQELTDLLEDYLDEKMALQLEKESKEKGIPMEQVMKELGIKPAKRVVKEETWTEERRKKLIKALDEVQGIWADDKSWPKTRTRRRKIELAASKKMRKAWW